MKTLVIALFALTYVLMLSIPKYRHFAALAVAGIYVVLGVVAPEEALGAIDWNVILMLAGTMGTVYLCIESQMPAAAADILVNKLKKVKLIFVALAIFAGVVSAFIDNIPYVATMLPVVSVIAGTIGIDPTVLYFGLLAGATLGGNITPVGASANIAAGGILRKEGFEVSTKEFMSIGVPFTLCAVVTGYVLIWLIYA